MPSRATEVRRCARCGQPTLVCVREWQRELLGIATGSQVLDLECTSCGVTVTLHPQTQIRGERLFAWLMLPAIFPSLYFFASARRKERAWLDNPVVGGLSHNPSTPRPRECVCSAAAACVSIHQHRLRGLPIGTSYQYACQSCARSFRVHDVASIAFTLFAGAVVGAFGALIITHPPGSAVGAEESNSWFGVGLVVFAAIAGVMALLQIRGRLAHPELL